MEYRALGRTGWSISAISFGAWAIGGDVWGRTDDAESLRTLHRAFDLGVNFVDTADVYGDGHSERLVARARRERAGEEIVVATKAGRRLAPHVAAGYDRANLGAFVERSLRNLDCDAIDLLQLHCPPSPVYEMPEVFGILDDLVAAGKLRHYGVSVERVDEALRALAYPNVQSVQIIFNMFRLKPAESFFAEARARQVGTLARVPLASGLLTGKLARDSQFASQDHRSFNRHGEAFDAGETFSGVDYETGLRAVDELRPLVPDVAVAGRAALDPELSRGDGGDPRRAHRGAGGIEHRRRRAAGAAAVHDGGGARYVRSPSARCDSCALVRLSRDEPQRHRDAENGRRELQLLL